MRRQVNELEIAALEKVRTGKPEPYVELKSQTVEQYLAGWEMDYQHANGRNQPRSNRGRSATSSRRGEQLLR